MTTPLTFTLILAAYAVGIWAAFLIMGMMGVLTHSIDEDIRGLAAFFWPFTLIVWLLSSIILWIEENKHVIPRYVASSRIWNDAVFRMLFSPYRFGKGLSERKRRNISLRPTDDLNKNSKGNI